MRPGMKMLMLTNRGGSGGRNEGGSGGQDEMRNGMEMRRGGSGSRNEMRGGYGETRGNYSGMNNRSNYARNEYENEMRDMDARFRGGERSDYNPYGEQMMEEAESRRRRDRMGRFTSEMEGAGMHYPYVPPIYEREVGGQMNVIGFERGNEMPSNYGMRAEHQRMDEMQHRGGQMQMGRGSHETKLTKEMAEEWMMGLQNEDGTKGPHWSMDQAKQVMQQRGIQADPVTFWAVLNMMYSDYCKVFKKHGVGDRVDFYSDITSAWLNDKDGPEPAKKAAAYYEYIVNQ